MPNEIVIQQFKPSEIINIFNDILAHQNYQASGKVVCIRGLYLKGNGGAYGGLYYDALRDDNTLCELPIKISEAHRRDLTAGNLVDVLGTLGRRITAKSEIKLELNVSRVDVVKEQVIDEDEVKRIEYRQRKVAAGFKNVDSILESMLMNEERPKIALLLPTAGIVMGDFEHGKRAASIAIDFKEERVTFTHTRELCAKLKDMDQQGYMAIALVRGGGIDPKTDVDKPEVIETVVGMKTPFISGLGHEPEKIFLRQVTDKWTPNPNALGQYFSELVEEVSEKRTKSRAALTEKIKKQFKEQIEEAQKQNTALQKKLADLTKTQEEAQKLQKTQTDQLTKLQEQFKTQAESLKKQTDSLTKLQTANGELNKSVQQLTVQHSLATKERDFAQEKVKELEGKLKGAHVSKIWIYVIITIIALIAGFVISRIMSPSNAY